MNRETTNRIRFVLEELVPPILRDSRLFRWLFRRYWGGLIDDLESFRARAHVVTEEEYADIYSALPRIQDGTDNSEACIARIASEALPGKILDVGCGTGELLRRLMAARNGESNEYTGVDFQIGDEAQLNTPGVEWIECPIEKLPFEDESFDTVICTHVLEHVLDLRHAIAELRRVCKQRLIVVVPKEREYRFTFNPHLHFFPYRHSFLKHVIPAAETAVCDYIGRDIYYREDRGPTR